MSLLRCVLALVVFVAILDKALSQKPHYDLGDAERLFAKFKHDHNKNYESPEDIEIHYEAFVLSLLRVNYLNSIQDTSTYDLNEFSDLTAEEIKKHLGVLTDDHLLVKSD